jgi:cystathionine beta-lyase family protein involved in aluminum resistance
VIALEMQAKDNKKKILNIQRKEGYAHHHDKKNTEIDRYIIIIHRYENGDKTW